MRVDEKISASTDEPGSGMEFVVGGVTVEVTSSESDRRGIHGATIIYHMNSKSHVLVEIGATNGVTTPDAKNTVFSPKSETGSLGNLPVPESVCKTESLEVTTKDVEMRVGEEPAGTERNSCKTVCN